MKIKVILFYLLLAESNIISCQIKANFSTQKIFFLGREINLVNAIVNIDQNKIFNVDYKYSDILFTFYFSNKINNTDNVNYLKQFFNQDSVHNFILINGGDTKLLNNFLSNKISNGIASPTTFYLTKNHTKFNLLEINNDIIWFSMPVINKDFLNMVDKITIGGQLDFLFNKNILIKKDKYNFYFRKFPNCISCDYSYLKNDLKGYEFLSEFDRCIMVIDKNIGVINLIEYSKIPFSN